jgi:nitrate/TMAO reductase-like tetraheme cytochrome c subunit
MRKDKILCPFCKRRMRPRSIVKIGQVMACRECHSYMTRDLEIKDRSVKKKKEIKMTTKKKRECDKHEKISHNSRKKNNIV